MNIGLSSIECTPATTRQKYSIIPCKVCGKEFVSVRVPKDICSVRCQENGELRRQNVRGAVYSFINKGNYTGRGYCSEACKEKALINKAIANGLYFPCKVCGKMFIAYGKNACFCSSNARRLTPSEKRRTPAEIRGKSPSRAREANMPYLRQGLTSLVRQRGRKYCSIACRQIAVKRRNEEAAIKRKANR